MREVGEPDVLEGMAHTRKGGPKAVVVSWLLRHVVQATEEKESTVRWRPKVEIDI